MVQRPEGFLAVQDRLAASSRDPAGNELRGDTIDGSILRI